MEKEPKSLTLIEKFVQGGPMSYHREHFALKIASGLEIEPVLPRGEKVSGTGPQTDKGGI